MRTRSIRKTAIAALLATATLSLLPANMQAKVKRTFNPPTMGWSSWNTFALNINEKVICGQADAMVKTGLKDAGYEYINIDDGYWNGRAANGELRINTDRFPNGMKYVADYIHKLGLKAGIYSDAGDNTCGSANTHAWGLGVGLAGHEEADCHLYFVDWGYDFIKVDYCGGNHMGLNERDQYTKISNAIKKCEKEKGKRIAFNICRWAYPGTWVNEIADSWRTTGDIYDAWKSVKDIVNENLYIQAYTNNGHYNDMDMLEIGRSMNDNEERTHMAYWCIASSPLLIGCDMSQLRTSSLNLMKNPDLIEMNQNCLGIGAPVVQRKGEVYVVAKDMDQLRGHRRAVVVMNLSDNEQTIDMNLAALEFEGTVQVHDCFGDVDDHSASNTMRVTIPAHGSQAYFITGKRGIKTLFEAEEAWLHDYQELYNKETARPSLNASASKGAFVGFIGNSATNYLEWRNVYVDKAGEYDMTVRFASKEDRRADVIVNGKHLLTMASLYSGDWNKWENRTTTITLQKGMNTIRLANANGFAPDIDCMTIAKHTIK